MRIYVCIYINLMVCSPPIAPCNRSDRKGHAGSVSFNCSPMRVELCTPKEIQQKISPFGKD